MSSAWTVASFGPSFKPNRLRVAYLASHIVGVCRGDHPPGWDYWPGRRDMLQEAICHKRRPPAIQLVFSGDSLTRHNHSVIDGPDNGGPRVVFAADRPSQNDPGHEHVLAALGGFYGGFLSGRRRHLMVRTGEFAHWCTGCWSNKIDICACRRLPPAWRLPTSPLFCLF